MLISQLSQSGFAFLILDKLSPLAGVSPVTVKSDRLPGDSLVGTPPLTATSRTRASDRLAGGGNGRTILAATRRRGECLRPLRRSRVKGRAGRRVQNFFFLFCLGGRTRHICARNRYYADVRPADCSGFTGTQQNPNRVSIDWDHITDDTLIKTCCAFGIVDHCLYRDSRNNLAILSSPALSNTSVALTVLLPCERRFGVPASCRALSWDNQLNRSRPPVWSLVPARHRTLGFDQSYCPKLITTYTPTGI